MADTYNGWTNYETWAVKLWIDNEQSSQEYWTERTIAAWQESDDRQPNQFMNRSENARTLLAEWLKDEFEDAECNLLETADASSSVFADLLGAALGRVDWREIADAMLRDMAENADDRTDYGQYQIKG